MHVVFVEPGTIANTIIAGNRLSGSFIGASANCSSFIGGLVDIGYNLTSAETGCAFTSATDVILPLAPQVFVSVLLPVMAQNGGGLPTHALIERGLAVDAGYCPGEAGDERGFNARAGC